MTITLSRRQMLGAIATAAVGTLTGCGPGGGGGGGALRVSSYGDQTKLKLRGEVVKKFTAGHKGVQMSFEGTPTADYWDKLATQISGGNAPDVINIDPVRIAQYGSNGVLTALGSYVPKTLQTNTFDANLLKQGRLGGKLYGVPIATSTYSIGYDTTVLDKIGVRIPASWTWDDYARIALNIHHASGKSFYGVEDAGGDITSFEVFLRTRGGALYKGSTEFGFDQATLTEWFSYWEKLRKNGGCVPADIGSQWVYGDWPNSPIVRGKAAMGHIMTPNFTGGFQALTKHTLAMTLPPRASANGPLGHYPAPSSLLSVNARCKDKDHAVEFVNWFVNNAQPWKMMKLISGPPASQQALHALEQLQLSVPEKKVLAYTQMATKLAKPAPPVPPKANTQVSDLMLRTNQDISFGRKKVPAAVDSFFSQAKSYLTQ